MKDSQCERTIDLTEVTGWVLSMLEASTWFRPEATFKHGLISGATTPTSAAQVERCHQIMLSELQMADEDVDNWLSLLEFGYDEPLKDILIALSEGLHDLTYVGYDEGEYGNAKKDPWTILTTSTRSILHFNPSGSCPWPFGFRALRNVVIAEKANYRRPQDAFSANATTVAALSMLPALLKLKLCLVGYVEEEVFLWEWDTQVSTVQDLVIHSRNIEDEDLASFIIACKAPRSSKCHIVMTEPLVCASLS